MAIFHIILKSEVKYMQFRINIIDDEKNLNDLVRTYLEKEGYIVYSFYTYDEALMHKDDDVHLWLIDIMLDRASGFELFNEIKECRPKMPIIFMSARDQEFDRIIGLEKGSDDYITKPFSTTVLCAKVKACLRRISLTAPAGPTVLTAGVFRYVCDEMKLYKNGEEIPLSSKEALLMKYFMSNTNRILTKEQIYSNVWNDSIIDDNTKDVWYWNNLVGRRKLGNTDQMHIYEVAGVKSIHSSNKANWMAVCDAQCMRASEAGTGIVNDLRTTVQAQQAAIEALAKSLGADPEQIAQAVQQAVRDKLDSLEITISAE